LAATDIKEVDVVSAKIGSGLYVVWGLLHLKAAYDEFVLGASVQSGLVQGKLNQGGWDLLFFALFAIAVALQYNWNNDTLGYWLNLIVVSAADLGFIIFVLIPGYVAIFPGVLGPIFWISAAIFSTIGFMQKRSALANRA
jgi:hypothetical protein